jgi:HK97 family phage portal protein
MIARPASLGVYEARSLRPNGNDPADVPPATVGPDVAVPGDPDGIDVVTLGQPVPLRLGPPPPSPWSGWPADWATSWDMGADHLANLSDVAWACLDLVADELAAMPPYLVNAAPSLDAAWLVNPDPDLYTGWYEFAKQLVWDFLTGEAFVLSTAPYRSGYPARFHVVAPWLVNVDMVDGIRRYSIGGGDVTDRIVHLRYTSRADSARGIGPLDVGRTRILAVDLLARYAFQFVAGGGVPTSVLEAPGELTAAQADDLREQWITARAANMGLPAVLAGGVTWQATQATPTDLALVPLMNVNEVALCRLLRVPPTLMSLPSGDGSLVYRNAEGIYDYFWRTGLRTRAVAICTALSAWLLPAGTTLEVNRDEFVKPGPLERAQTDAVLHGIQEIDDTGTVRYAKTLDEIRIGERFDTPTTLNAPGVLR